jgi:nitrite reductase (NADH) small subunit
MTKLTEVARISDIPPGTGVAVATQFATVALFNVDGEFFALDDACVRCGSSLAAGSVEGKQAVCADCSWRYDLDTGQVVGVPSLRMDTFEVSTSGSHVFVAHRFRRSAT